MPAYARTIKPELFSDARTAGLSSHAFRLFIAMITHADDYGNLRGGAAYLKKTAFWGLHPSSQKRVHIVDLMDELIIARLIEPYEVRGQEYVHVSNWDKHQRIDRPHRPEVPAYPYAGQRIGQPKTAAEDSQRTHSEPIANPQRTHSEPTANQLRTSDATISDTSGENCKTFPSGSEWNGKDPDPDPERAYARSPESALPSAKPDPAAPSRSDPAPARDPLPAPYLAMVEQMALGRAPPKPEANDDEPAPAPPPPTPPRVPPPEYFAMVARITGEKLTKGRP